MLSRALCRFKQFDLSRLPADKRRAALGLQLPQWSPYRDSDYAVSWAEGVAMVWCWDRAIVEEALRTQGRSAKGLRTMPESLLHPPQADGVRLLFCMDGFEAQCWRASLLVASRWWPQAPNAQALLSFQRDCNLRQEEQQVDVNVQNLSLLDRPWCAFSAGSTADGGAVNSVEMVFYAVLILVLGLPAMALGFEQYRLARAADALTGEIAQMSQQSGPLLQARSAALAIQDQIRSLDGLQRFPVPLTLMVAVARALPDGGAFVKEWEMSDGKLKILIGSPTAEIAGAASVSALEKSGLFTEVKLITQANPKQMGFAMLIRTQESLDLVAANVNLSPNPDR